MINYLVESSVCLLVFFVADYIFFRTQTNHNLSRFHILLGIWISLIVPSLTFNVFPEVIDDTNIALYSSFNKKTIELGTISRPSLLVTVYWIGVFISFLIFLIELFRLFSILKAAGVNEKFGRTIHVTKSQISISSFLHFLIVSEGDFDDMDIVEVEHELVHQNQGHSLDLVFIRIVRVFFWFHPGVYFLQNRLREIHEYLADQEVCIRIGMNSYLDKLSHSIEQKSLITLNHNFYSLIKKRISMMQQTKKKAWNYLLIIPIIGVSLMSVFSFQSYPIYKPNGKISIDEKRMYSDSLPLNKLLDLDSIMVIDTIDALDENTLEEVIHIIPRMISVREDFKTKGITDFKGMIDTILDYDEDTFEETKVIVNYETGKIDTIK